MWKLQKSALQAARINRNIVECKLSKMVPPFAGRVGINRNIVECKLNYLISLGHKKIELIETLWNVNVSAFAFSFFLFEELIETLWNVNKSSTKIKGKNMIPN